MKRKILCLVLTIFMFMSSLMTTSAAPQSVTFNSRKLSGVNIQSGSSSNYKTVSTGNATVIAFCLNKSLKSPSNGATLTFKEKMIDEIDSIMWELAKDNLENVNGRTAFDAAKKGDTAAKEVVDMYIKYLACGLTNMVNIFQPQVLCIGGGVCGEGDYLLKPLIKTIRRWEYGGATQTNFSQIKIAELGNDAGIIGAAFLGLTSKR